MPKFTVYEELEIAIKAAATERGTSWDLADRFYRQEPEFVRQFQEQWGIAAIRAMIVRERGKTRKKSARAQLGFGTVGKIVLRSSGEPYRDGQATLWQLQQLRKQLGATDHPALAEVVKRIEFMTPYAHAERGITFARACKLALEEEG
jgi:hypothetical protein